MVACPEALLQLLLHVRGEGRLEVDLGVDACMSILGAKTCGGDLFSGLPIYVLQGEFDFSVMCNHKLKALRRKAVNATA